MMKQAVKFRPFLSTMIRTKTGLNFTGAWMMASFSYAFEDIEACASAGLNGVVLGVLKPNGSIDMPQKRVGNWLTAHSLKLGITFHRASNIKALIIKQPLETGHRNLMWKGPNVASSVNAEQGINVLAEAHKQADNRIDIMAVLASTQRMRNDSKHHPSTCTSPSGKSTRPSLMESNSNAQMGSDDIDDYQIPRLMRIRYPMGTALTALGQ